MRLPLALVSSLCFVGLASAQPGPGEAATPLLVVIESGGTSLHAAQLRADIAAHLELPVVSVLELTSVPSRGTLSIALDASGKHARLVYVPVDGEAFAAMASLELDPSSGRAREGIVAQAVALVRASEARRFAAMPTSELLDPWLPAHAQPGARRAGLARRSELLDPFVGVVRRPVDPRGREYELRPDVIDPWSAPVRSPSP